MTRRGQEHVSTNTTASKGLRSLPDERTGTTGETLAVLDLAPGVHTSPADAESRLGGRRSRPAEGFAASRALVITASWAPG